MMKIIIVLLSILTIISGIWLHSTGRPLNTFIFAIHKLAAVAVLVLTAILVYNLFKDADVTTIISVMAVTAVVSVLALFTSGILLSFEKLANNLLIVLHNIATVLAITTATASIYFLAR